MIEYDEIIELLGVILLLLVIIGLTYYFSDSRKKNRKPEFNLFDAESELIAKTIAEIKWKYNIEELLPEHLLFALLDKPGTILFSLFSEQRINIKEVKKDLASVFEKENTKELDRNENINIGKYLAEIIENVNKRNLTRITPMLLFESLLSRIINSRDNVYDISRSAFQKNNVSPDKLLQVITKVLDK